MVPLRHGTSRFLLLTTRYSHGTSESWYLALPSSNHAPGILSPTAQASLSLLCHPPFPLTTPALSSEPVPAFCQRANSHSTIQQVSSRFACPAPTRGASLRTVPKSQAYASAREPARACASGSEDESTPPHTTHLLRALSSRHSVTPDQSLSPWGHLEPSGSVL